MNTIGVDIDVDSRFLVYQIKRGDHYSLDAHFDNSKSEFVKFIRWATKSTGTTRVSMKSTGVCSNTVRLGIA